MLTDDIRIKNPQRPVLDRVASLSENDVEGALVFLTETDGPNEPGVYFRNDVEWVYLKEEQLKILAQYLPTADSFDNTIVGITGSKTIIVTGRNATSYLTPVPVGEFRNVAVGNRNACAVRTDGTLAAWGQDSSSMVSTCPTDDGYISVVGTNSAFFALKDDGSVVTWGTSTLPHVTELPTGIPFKAIYSNHSQNMFGLTLDGTIIAWGSASNGMTDVPSGSGYIQVVAGTNCGFTLDSNGNVDVFGASASTYGPDAPEQAIYLDAYGTNFQAILPNNSVVAWGANSSNDLSTIGDYNDIVFLCSANRAAVLLNTFGELYPVGDDGSSQLSDIPGSGRVVDAAVAYNDHISLLESGRVRNMGAYSYAGNTTDFRENSDFIHVFSDTSHVYGIRQNGKIVTTSNNTAMYNTLNASTSFFIKGQGGQYNVIALREDGEVEVFGTDDYDQVSNIPAGPFVDVSMVQYTCFAKRADGTWVGWGDDSDNKITDLPSFPMDKIASASQNSYTCVALLPDNSLHMWGRDTQGLYANKPTGNDIVDVSVYGSTALAVKSDGTCVYWGFLHTFTNNTISSAEDIIACAVGPQGAILLKNDKTQEWHGSVNYGLPDVIVMDGFLLPY